MAYAYWKSGKVDDSAVFDLYFRKNPFEGEFTIFAGLDECLRFLENFRYSDTDIEYLKETLPEGIENEFFEYLRQLTASEITLHAVEEGSVAFPRYFYLVAALIRERFQISIDFQRSNSEDRGALDHCPAAGDNTLDPRELCEVNFFRCISADRSIKPNNSLSLQQSDGHKCSKISHGCWKAYQTAGIRIASSSRSRWWPICLKICVHWWVILFIRNYQLSNCL